MPVPTGTSDFRQREGDDGEHADDTDTLLGLPAATVVMAQTTVPSITVFPGDTLVHAERLVPHRVTTLPAEHPLYPRKSTVRPLDPGANVMVITSKLVARRVGFVVCKLTVGNDQRQKEQGSSSRPRHLRRRDRSVKKKIRAPAAPIHAPETVDVMPTSGSP